MGYNLERNRVSYIMSLLILLVLFQLACNSSKYVPIDDKDDVYYYTIRFEDFFECEQSSITQDGEEMLKLILPRYQIDSSQLDVIIHPYSHNEECINDFIDNVNLFFNTNENLNNKIRFLADQKDSVNIIFIVHPLVDFNVDTSVNIEVIKQP